MYDNNDKNINNEHHSLEQKKASVNMLRKIVEELEEELYSCKIELKAQSDYLKEKELELAERERTKVHNIDLFSPIYNKTFDAKELIASIDQMRNKLIEINNKQQQILDKITGIRTATQFLEDSIKKSEEHTEVKRSEAIGRLSNIGLSILEAQEMERQRIARDLHDGTVQNLTSLVHKTELCIKLIDIDTIRAKLELNTMSNTIKTIINDMRGFIYNLKPMSLDDLGLTITVERYADKIMNCNNIRVIVNSNEEPSEILPVIKLTLFRIVQEACHNVVKHANASLINIDINYYEDIIEVIIKDDGIGFDIKKREEEAQAASFGISIMKERISLLSGSVKIQSEKGNGTMVTVSAPLTKREEEKNEQTD